MNIPKLSEQKAVVAPVETPKVDTQPPAEEFIFRQESRHDASPSNWCITPIPDEEDFYNIRNIVTNREVICTLEEFNDMLRG